MDSAAESGDDDAADGPAEVARRGGPGLFLLLTCGFLACLCCLGAVFVGGSVAWVRMGNLDDAIERLGVPHGWHKGEESSLPWGAEAELSGPAEAEPVRDWLELIGTPPSKKRVGSCLKSEKKCTVEGTYLGFPVSFEYGAGGEESAATVHVG